jgi:hypothetical protein
MKKPHCHAKTVIWQLSHLFHWRLITQGFQTGVAEDLIFQGMVCHTTDKWFLMFFIRHLDSPDNANTFLRNIGSSLTVDTAEHP